MLRRQYEHITNKQVLMPSATVSHSQLKINELLVRGDDGAVADLSSAADGVLSGVILLSHSLYIILN